MKTFVSWILCLMLIFACAQAAAGQTAGAQEDGILRIAVATDLHVNPKNWDYGMVNPLMPYHLQIVDAFLWDAAECGVDVLLLCGDITNQGRLDQHEALVGKLRAAEESGMAVYVLPGNHDIGEVSAAQFAQLYADFGYGEAYSRDAASLSYSVLLGRRMLLMLDTNGYVGHQNIAYLTDETLAWMSDQLSLAAENGWEVIACGHYPICTPHQTEFVGREKALRLLEENGVQLYLSGHLHKRCVTVEDDLTELVVDQTIAYPCCYALLEADGEDGYRYQPQAIDVSAWAKQTGQDDANLLAFEAYQRQMELRRCRDVVSKVKKEQEVSPQALKQAEEFFWLMSDYRAHGVLSRYADILLVHPGCQVMIDMGAGTIYSWWIPATLTGAVPYTAGFILRDHRIAEIPDDVD